MGSRGITIFLFRKIRLSVSSFLFMRLKTKKLNELDIIEIKNLLSKKVKQKYIAQQFNVSEQLISNIKHNLRYGI